MELTHRSSFPSRTSTAFNLSNSSAIEDTVVTLNPSHNEGLRGVFITGVSGILGRATVHKFATHGFKVISLTRPTPAPFKFDLRDQFMEVRRTIDVWGSAIEEENPLSVTSCYWDSVDRETKSNRAI